MQRHKRVAAVLGLVGVLVTLLSFAAATPASSAPGDNVVQVTKIVNGTPTQPGNFEVTVSCNGILQTLTFPQTGGTQSVEFPPAATNCILFESQARGANVAPNTAVVQVTSATAAIVLPVGLDATAASSITFDPGGSQSANAVIVNSYAPVNPNIVRVTKAPTGTVPPGAFYQVNVTCGADTVSLAFPTAGGTQDALFPGSNCAPTVSESQTWALGAPVVPAPISVNFNPGGTVLAAAYPAFSFPVPSPAPLAAFTNGVNGGQTRTVTVTNRYPDSSSPNLITVNKRVRGDVPANAQFTVQVVCAPNPADPALPAFVPQSFTYGAAGGSHVFTVSKEYRSCTVTETASGGAISVDSQATPAGEVVSSVGNTTQLLFNAGGNRSAEVTVTNRFPGGPDILTVNKVTTGQVPAGTLFIIRVQCSADLDNTIPGFQGTKFLLFGDGQPSSQDVRVAQVPGPSICIVVETVSGGAVSRTYTASSLTQPNSTTATVQDPGGFASVTFPFGPGNPNGDEAQVTVTNNFPPGPPLADNVLRIKKQLRGRIPAGASFEIKVRCSGGGITDVYNLTFTSNSFQEINVPANRADCRVTETVNGGAQSVVFTASSATADATDGATSARVDFGDTGGQRGKVIVSNRFPGTCPRPGPKFC